MAKRTVVDGRVMKLAADKLALSGITLEQAKDLKIEVLTAEQTARLGFAELASLKLNYYGPTGKPLITWPKSAPFYRVRFLEQPSDFNDAANAKQQRYSQPKGTVCAAYFAQNIDWNLLSTDQAIIITEGELKAAAACAQGFACIGLGGVYNWSALGNGIELLPELKRINWVRRTVYVCFDSDYLTNPMVCAALQGLADALIDEGAFVHVANLPVIEEGQKTGLDDLIVAEGADSLERVLQIAPALGLTKALFGFNAQYVYVRNPGLVMEQATMSRVTPAAFREHLESTKLYQERALKQDGTISHKPVPAGAAWLGWPMRYEVKRLAYEPGQPRHIEKSCEYNLWPGWGVEPKKGDIKPFLKLVDHIFTGAEPAAKKWFLQWLAYPLQYPGSKMFSAAVLHGRGTGTGKSLIGYTLGAIYGKNFQEIKQGNLFGSFNDWAENKQFIMGDDISGSNKRQEADILKTFITQKSMTINVKYVPSYTVRDCINYLFTSNHADVFFLEDEDRRFFIHEVTVQPLDRKFYTEYAGQPGQPSWLYDKGGAEAVFEYLLHLDLKGFSPTEHAMKTQARERMISGIQSDLGGWVRRLKEDADNVLKLGTMPYEKDMATNQQLLAMYDPMGKTGTTANGLGREMVRGGFTQVMGGKPIRVDGVLARYYVVRNAAKWLHSASMDEMIKHLSSPALDVAAKKKRKGGDF